MIVARDDRRLFPSARSAAALSHTDCRRGSRRAQLPGSRSTTYECVASAATTTPLATRAARVMIGTGVTLPSRTNDAVGALTLCSIEIARPERVAASEHRHVVALAHPRRQEWRGRGNHREIARQRGADRFDRGVGRIGAVAGQDARQPPDSADRDLTVRHNRRIGADRRCVDAGTVSEARRRARYRNRLLRAQMPIEKTARESMPSRRRRRTAQEKRASARSAAAVCRAVRSPFSICDSA